MQEPSLAKNQQPKIKKMYTDFIVDKIERESETIKSFYLKKKDNQPLDSYLPGQFISLKVQPNGNTYHRNYTLSDSPDKAYYRLTVKKEDEGKVSGFLHNEVKVGDSLELSKPGGNFHLSGNTNTPVVLLSGGVGITPMLSMLEYVVACEPQRPVYFVHSSLNKTVQHTLTRIKDLAQQYDNVQVSIHHTQPTLDEIAGQDYDHKGFITATHLQNLLPDNTPEVYLCGPVSFMEAMYGHLLELDFDKNNIFYEFFGEGKALGIDPTFKDSQTNTFTVKFTESGTEATWNGEQPALLDFAEAEGLTPEFGCRTGTCFACETTLIKGKVSYDPEPFLEVPEGKVLLCCAQPASDVEIEA